MEQHPVPKNILDVEFKLFGSLTVRQFGKILLGCFVGLVIFLLQLNPLISLPLIAASVGTGIMSALVKDFEVRFVGILKSIFISPQYVWKKTGAIPDVLKEDEVVKSKSESKREGRVTKQGGEQSLESSIERFLSSRSEENVAAEPLPEPGLPQRGTNLERMYSDLFKEELAHPQQVIAAPVAETVTQGEVGLAGPIAPVGGEVIQVGPNQQVVMKSVRNQGPRLFGRAVAGEIKSAPAQQTQLTDDQIEALKLELAQLQSKMVSLNKGGDKAQATEVMNRINAIYSTLRPYLLPAQTTVSSELAAINPATALYGVIVDRKDQPIAGATINILDLHLKPMVPHASSGADGKFAIAVPASLGDYVADVRHDSHKFNQFKIKVDGNKLPAFKFRER